MHTSGHQYILFYFLFQIRVNKKRGKQNRNKRPMGHIAHLRKQFKSINTYDYIITLIKRRKKYKPYDNLLFFHLNPHPMMLCAKIGWNWLSGSGEEIFLISSMFFHHFVIISTWKRAGPFIWTNLNPLHPRMLVPSLVEIGSVVLEKKIF